MPDNKEEILQQQRDRLYDELEVIRDTFKAAIANHRKGKGGQQVPYHGDFASMPPSSIGQMEWWVKRWDGILNIPEFEGLKK